MIIAAFYTNEQACLGGVKKRLDLLLALSSIKVTHENLAISGSLRCKSRAFLFLKKHRGVTIYLRERYCRRIVLRMATTVANTSGVVPDAVLALHKHFSDPFPWERKVCITIV